MSNPFADIPTRGGSYLKFGLPGESHTGIIKGTRVGKDFDQENDVPEIILEIGGEEKILGCENAALHNWAVANGEQIAASIGQPLTVTFTGKSGQVKLYDCVIGGAATQPAPLAAPTAAPVAAPHAAPMAPPVAAPAAVTPAVAPAMSPDAVA